MSDGLHDSAPTSSPRQRLRLATLLAIGIAPFFVNGIYNPILFQTKPALFWGAELLTWFVMPLILLTIALQRDLVTRQQLGLSTQIRGRSNPWIIFPLLFLVPWLFWHVDTITVHWAHANLPQPWRMFDYLQVIPPPGPATGGYRLLALAWLCLTAAFVEELYYRAALDQLFPRNVLGAILYIAVSTALFTGAHWESGPRTLAEACAVGLFAAATFRTTQNLWPLILGHFIVDWYWLSN